MSTSLNFQEQDVIALARTEGMSVTVGFINDDVKEGDRPRMFTKATVPAALDNGTRVLGETLPASAWTDVPIRPREKK